MYRAHGGSRRKQVQLALHPVWLIREVVVDGEHSELNAVLTILCYALARPYTTRTHMEMDMGMSEWNEDVDLAVLK